MCNTASMLLTVCLTAIYLYRLSFVTHVTLKSGKIGGVEKKNYVGLKGVKNMCNMCICNTCTQKWLFLSLFLGSFNYYSYLCRRWEQQRNTLTWFLHMPANYAHSSASVRCGCSVPFQEANRRRIVMWMCSSKPRLQTPLSWWKPRITLQVSFNGLLTSYVITRIWIHV